MLFVIGIPDAWSKALSFALIATFYLTLAEKNLKKLKTALILLLWKKSTYLPKHADFLP